MSKKFTHHFKLLILGESAVGKTCILLRYTEDSFSIAHMTTIGIDFKNKILNMDQKKIRLQIWDTAGQDRYKTVTKQFYKGAQGIILVYDITNRDSFLNVKNWVEQIDQNAKPNISKVLVGNKADLEDKRAISKEEGSQLAEEFKMKFFEASAAQNIGIAECFDYMTGELLKMKDKDEGGTPLVGFDTNKKDKKCCGGKESKVTIVSVNNTKD